MSHTHTITASMLLYLFHFILQHSHTPPYELFWQQPYFLAIFLIPNLIFYHQISSCLHHKSIQPAIYINTSCYLLYTSVEIFFSPVIFSFHFFYFFWIFYSNLLARVSVNFPRFSKSCPSVFQGFSMGCLLTETYWTIHNSANTISTSPFWVPANRHIFSFCHHITGLPRVFHQLKEVKNF